jgi:hypothetical protein
MTGDEGVGAVRLARPRGLRIWSGGYSGLVAKSSTSDNGYLGESL